MVSVIMECKPEGFFRTRFTGLTDSKPRYLGFIMSVRQAAGTEQLVVTCHRQTRDSWCVSYVAASI